MSLNISKINDIHPRPFKLSNNFSYIFIKFVEWTGSSVNLIENGLKEIYVNTAINDGTEISELMKCFLQEQVDNDKFPLLSNRVWYFKNDEGGIDAMCKIVEDYANEKSLAGIKNLFKNGCSLEIVVNSFPNIPKEIICEIYDKATKKTSA